MERAINNSLLNEYKLYLSEHPKIKETFLFWIKSSIALILTSFLAFEFETPEAAWAVICASILVHPDSGAVLSKSVARIIGTIVGASVAITLFFFFPQAPWMFLLFLSIWVAICSYYSAFTRDFKTYAVALSGFMPAIIFMTAIQNSEIDEVVRIASLRAATITLGIICVAIVFGLTHIREGYKGFLYDVTKANNYIKEILLKRVNGQLNLDIVRNFSLYIEDAKRKLNYASAEDPEIKVRADSGRGLLNDIFCATVDLNNYIAIGLTKNWISDSDKESVNNFINYLQLTGDELCVKLSDILENPKIKDTSLRRRVMILAKFILYLQMEFSNKPINVIKRKLGVFVDEKLTIRMTIGAFLVTMTASLIWILSEWPMGPFFITFSAASYLLQATKDNYGRESLQYLIGAIISIIPAFFVEQIFMPITYGFVWYAFWLSIGIIPATVLKASNKYSTVGVGCFLFTMILISPANTMNYDFQNFLNTYMAACAAAAISFATIVLIMPWSPENRIKRLLKIGRKTVSELAFISNFNEKVSQRMDIEQDRYNVLARFCKSKLIPENSILDKRFISVISIIRIFEIDDFCAKEMKKQHPEIINKVEILWGKFDKLDNFLSLQLISHLNEMAQVAPYNPRELLFMIELCKKMLLEDDDVK